MLNRTPLFRDPVFRSLASFANEFDRACVSPGRVPNRAVAPAINVLASEDALTIEADVPGMALDDIEIVLNGDEITIRGTREQTVAEGTSVLRRERSIGAFERTFSLGAEIDTENASASLDRGVLTISLPKSQAARPRRLSITQASAMTEHASGAEQSTQQPDANDN